MRRALISGLLGTALLASAGVTHAGETSLGVEVGYVKAKGLDSSLFFGGDFRFHLSKSFALEPGLSYWSKSPTALGITVSVGDFQLGFNALGVIHASRSVEIFGGAGAGLHHISGDVRVKGGSAFSGSTTKPGLDVVGGLDFRAGRSLSFFLAARYDWVLNLDGEDSSRMDQEKFSGGFRLRF